MTIWLDYKNWPTPVQQSPIHVGRPIRNRPNMHLTERVEEIDEYFINIEVIWQKWELPSPSQPSVARSGSRRPPSWATPPSVKLPPGLLRLFALSFLPTWCLYAVRPRAAINSTSNSFFSTLTSTPIGRTARSVWSPRGLSRRLLFASPFTRGIKSQHVERPQSAFITGIHVLFRQYSRAEVRDKLQRERKRGDRWVEFLLILVPL